MLTTLNSTISDKIKILTSIDLKKTLTKAGLRGFHNDACCPMAQTPKITPVLKRPQDHHLYEGFP